jgi:hypothetical protein
MSFSRWNRRLLERLHVRKRTLRGGHDPRAMAQLSVEARRRKRERQAELESRPEPSPWSENERAAPTARPSTARRAQPERAQRSPARAGVSETSTTSRMEPLSRREFLDSIGSAVVPISAPSSDEPEPSRKPVGFLPSGHPVFEVGRPWPSGMGLLSDQVSDQNLKEASDPVRGRGEWYPGDRLVDVPFRALPYSWFGDDG